MFKKLTNIFKSLMSDEGMDRLVDSADKFTDKLSNKLTSKFEGLLGDYDDSSVKESRKKESLKSNDSQSSADKAKIAELEERIRKMEQSARGENDSKKTKPAGLTIEKYMSSTDWRNQDSYFHSPKLVFSVSLYNNGRTRNQESYEKALKKIESNDYKFALWSRGIRNNEMALFSDGKVRRIGYVGNTLREVKAFATLIGYPIPEKPKTAILAAEIVREKGENGVCICGDRILYPNGVVRSILGNVNFDNLLDEVFKLSDWFVMPSRPDMKGLTPGECLEKYIDFIDAITPNPEPSKEEIIKQFNAYIDDWKKEHPEGAWT